MFDFARSIASAMCLVLLIVIGTGCDPDAFSRSGQVATQATETSGQAPDYIVIGSFNIQRFGPTKGRNTAVMSYLKEIVKRFDIIAIQELQDSNLSVVESFVASLNDDGSSYDYVVGPSQGWNTYKEQYLYIYDSAKLELIAKPFVADDVAKVLDRPPFVARFRCKHLPPETAFTFALANIHTVHDDIQTELPALVPVMNGIRESTNNVEDDLILIGDLNGPPRFFQQFPYFENQLAIIADDWATNTKGDRHYDNIVIDAQRTSEFLDESGVFNFMNEYELSYENAKQISDHLPVWGVFSTREAPVFSLSQRNADSVR